MSITAIILAAGKGTRMNSGLPKVLHPLCGRPMLSYVIDACRQAGCDKIVLVVGHRAELVKQTYAENADVSYVLQQPQMGTGHAVMVCKDELASLQGPVLVIAGDGPLIRAETLRELIKTHTEKKAACTLATSILDDPAKYGRIIRDKNGDVSGIVEWLEASEQERQIREVNVSLYCFDAADLRSVIGRITNDNNKGEYYITDTLGLLRGDGKRIAAVAAVPPEDVLSINTPAELEEVGRIMAARSAT